ncbi:MAG: allantoicase [Chitinophagales bacterium]
MTNTPLLSFVDLAAEKIGGKVVYATDDFFAEKENLIKDGRGIFIPDKYTDRGKWMDGWESRRKRTEGHDFCIIALGAEGIIKGFDIDTNHFLGNHPPFASVEAINLKSKVEDWVETDQLDWKEILPKSPLNPGSQHFFEIDNKDVFTHVRLHIYPDGGVARCRVYGEVFKNWSTVSNDQSVDLALITNGAKALACNDMFFSSMNNLIMPFKGKNMGDGWETKRNRIPNNVDWVIVKLAHKGIIQKIIVDTNHFKGNYPYACSIEVCNEENDKSVMENQVQWQVLLDKSKLEAHREHEYSGSQIIFHEPITHVKLKIYPDGGVSRLRLFGNIVNN